MPQTSVIFFYILIGFVIYTAAKGELGQYLNLALGKNHDGTAVGSS